MLILQKYETIENIQQKRIHKKRIGMSQTDLLSVSQTNHIPVQGKISQVSQNEH